MKQRFLTQGIEASIPLWLQNLMWHMRDVMEVTRKDYLQVFVLSPSGDKQKLVHTQENPHYRHEVSTKCEDAISEKVYIIDDGTHVTMLLASEY